MFIVELDPYFEVNMWPEIILEDWRVGSLSMNYAREDHLFLHLLFAYENSTFSFWAIKSIVLEELCIEKSTLLYLM